MDPGAAGRNPGRGCAGRRDRPGRGQAHGDGRAGTGGVDRGRERGRPERDRGNRPGAIPSSSGSPTSSATRSAALPWNGTPTPEASHPAVARPMPTAVAAASRVLAATAGTQTATASSPGLDGSPVTFTHTGMPGSAASLVLVSGNNQSAEPGAELPDPVVVRLVDARGESAGARRVDLGRRRGRGKRLADHRGDRWRRSRFRPLDARRRGRIEHVERGRVRRGDRDLHGDRDRRGWRRRRWGRRRRRRSRWGSSGLPGPAFGCHREGAHPPRGRRWRWWTGTGRS